MSKFLKGIAVSLALVAMLFTVVGIAAVAPKTASADYHSEDTWGIITKNTPESFTNPWSEYYQITTDTQLNPTMLCIWNAAFSTYYWCLLTAPNSCYPSSFSYKQGNGYWLRFGPGNYPNGHRVYHYYAKFNQDYIERTDLILPGWNMVGSPYAWTGVDLVRVNTPMDNFQFCVDYYNYPQQWLNFTQAKAAGWLTGHCAWWWDCELNPQAYLELASSDSVPYSHGFWLYSSQIMHMRVQRPPGISSAYVSGTIAAPISGGTSGTPATEGAPPAPY